MTGFKKIKFKNGLRLILVSQPSSLAATVLILVETGSEYETKEINGISHFLEHLMFKGTKKRPRPGMISDELDGLGAAYNAFTGQEYTGYYAKVQSAKMDKAIDIVSDLYLNPIFDPKEIDKERGVIIEEINMYEDTPMRKVGELFTDVLYGDQPAGWDIAGKKEIIKKLTREDFEGYRGKHYVASKTVVVVAGNFDAEKVEGQVKETFGHLGAEKKLAKIKTKESQKAPQVLVRFKESDQSHLVLGVRAFDVFDKRRYVIKVLENVLGGGMSSRLFHKVREELGAAYYIRAESDLMLDHGFFAVSAGVDHLKIEVVIKTILSEMKKLAMSLVPAKELTKSKDHLIGNLILGLETSDELASFYGGQEILTGKVSEPEELIKKVRAVKAGEIRDIAKALFKNNSLNLAIIGPYKGEESFKKILRF